jgi:hypothetical protein
MHGPSPRRPSFDQLEQVHELNRLFLGFLQTRARRNGDCLGLPDASRSVLLKADGAQLDQVAAFPRALFSLSLDEAVTLHAMDPLPSAADSARQSVNITILLCAWNFSRQRVHQARVLLGLKAQTIQRLRALQLAELPRVALSPHLVSCAFAGADWLWTQLLTETRPEARQQLALVALQPSRAEQSPLRGVGRHRS